MATNSLLKRGQLEGRRPYETTFGKENKKMERKI